MMTFTPLFFFFVIFTEKIIPLKAKGQWEIRMLLQAKWLLCCPSNMRHALPLQCPELICPLLRNICMAPSLSSFKSLFKYLLSEAFASLSKLQPHLHQHQHCYFTYTKTHTQTHSLFPTSYFFYLGNHNKWTYYVMKLWTVCINVL